MAKICMPVYLSSERNNEITTDQINRTVTQKNIQMLQKSNTKKVFLN